MQRNRVSSCATENGEGSPGEFGAHSANGEGMSAVG